MCFLFFSPSFSCFFSCFLFFGSWTYAMGHGVKKCRPFPRVIARIHLAITSMNVSCRFVQDALTKTCSSFCRHAEFKYMFDLKISLVTRASSLKIIQLLTFIIVLWPSERGTMQCEENNRNRMSMQKWHILQQGHWRTCKDGVFGLTGSLDRWKRNLWVRGQYSSRKGNKQKPWNLDDFNEEPDPPLRTLAKSFGAPCITNDHTNHSNQGVSWSLPWNLWKES